MTSPHANILKINGSFLIKFLTKRLTILFDMLYYFIWMRNFNGFRFDSQGRKKICAPEFFSARLKKTIV